MGEWEGQCPSFPPPSLLPEGCLTPHNPKDTLREPPPLSPPCHPCQLGVTVSPPGSPPARPPQLQKQDFISHEQLWIKINSWPRSLLCCHRRCCVCV